jgi:hypothetical protein
MSNDGSSEKTLRSYKGLWNKKGPLLLACRKCQRKLKHEGHPLAQLRKLLKKRSRKLDFERKPLVIETPCLKVCPRGGVTICTQAQAGRGEFSILRHVRDVDLLVLQCIPEENNGAGANESGEPNELAAG